MDNKNKLHTSAPDTPAGEVDARSRCLIEYLSHIAEYVKARRQNLSAQEIIDGVRLEPDHFLQLFDIARAALAASPEPVGGKWTEDGAVALAGAINDELCELYDEGIHESRAIASRVAVSKKVRSIIARHAPPAAPVGPEEYRLTPDGPPMSRESFLRLTIRKPAPVGFKLDISREWCMNAAEREGDSEIGAGALASDDPRMWPAPVAGDWMKEVAQEISFAIDRAHGFEPDKERPLIAEFVEMIARHAPPADALVEALEAVRGDYIEAGRQIEIEKRSASTPRLRELEVREGLIRPRLEQIDTALASKAGGEGKS
jgi:hypothetical protein